MMVSPWHKDKPSGVNAETSIKSKYLCLRRNVQTANLLTAQVTLRTGREDVQTQARGPSRSECAPRLLCSVTTAKLSSL